MRTLLLLLALAYFVTPSRDVTAQHHDFSSGGGFTLDTPEGWDGPVQADESHLPQAAQYRLRNTAAGPLAGATATVILRANLNPLQRQQWLRGRFALGLGALRPVGPLSGAALPFQDGVGVQATGEGRTAMIYFTSHGSAHYAVVVDAPERQFAEAQPALLDLVRSIRFTAPLPEATAGTAPAATPAPAGARLAPAAPAARQGPRRIGG